MVAAHLQTHDVGTATRGLLRIETTTNSPQLMRPVGALAPISGPGDPDDDRESDVGEATLGDSNVGGLPGVAVCISDPLTSRTACVQTPVVPGSGPNSWTATGQDTSLGTIAGFRAQEPHVHTPPASIALASGCSVWPDKSRVLPQAGSTDHPTHPSGVKPNVFSSSSADDHSAGNDTVVRNRMADKASAILGSPIREPIQESQPSALGSGNAMYGTSLCDTDQSINKSFPTSHLARRSSTTCSVAETAACNSASGVAARSSSPTPVVSRPNSSSHGFQLATPLLHGGRPSDRHRAPSSVFSIKSGIMGRDEDGTFQREKTHPLVGTAQLRKTQHDLEEELRYLTLPNRQHISTFESAVPSLPAQKPVGCLDPVEPSTCTGAATGVGTAHFVEALDQSTPAGEPEDILGHSPSLHSPSTRSTDSESGASDGMTHVSLVDRIRGEVKVIAGKVKRDPAKIAQGRALMSGDH